MNKCIICETELVGKQIKYCSSKCNRKRYNSTPERKLAKRNYQRKNNKYIKKDGDVWDRTGESNSNWKGGISKDNMRYRKKFVQNNPEIIKVQGKTEYAIKMGVLIKEPCEICGNEDSEAHHDDYSNQLEVRWLCRKHHVIENKIRKNKLLK